MNTKQSTLTRIVEEKSALDMEFLSKESIAWLQSRMRDLRGDRPQKLAKEIAVEKKSQRTRFLMGGLYHFFYDPKTKEEMPYYDIFPLVIPLEKYDDGFLGLNLHYLPPRLRAVFLDKLMYLALLNNDDEPVRFRVTYEILSDTRKFKEFRPCIKRYLTSHVKSKIMTIRPDEWEVCIFLPTSQFKGETNNRVYSDSIKQIKKAH